MSKPYVICHMTSAVDGRVKIRQWSEIDNAGVVDAHYERLHEELGGDAWVVGRVTMQGYTRGEAPAPYDGPAIARETHVAKPDADGYAIGFDAHARLHWGDRNDISGDHVVMVLTEAASDAHLDALRRSGVSYVFGGADRIDISRVLETLNEAFGIKRLLVEGGGRINGSFLKAGVIDEVSLLLAPAVDGVMGTPAVFDTDENAEGYTAKAFKLTLESHEVLEGGVMWLRYKVSRADAT